MRKHAQRQVHLHTRIKDNKVKLLLKDERAVLSAIETTCLWCTLDVLSKSRLYIHVPQFFVFNFLSSYFFFSFLSI